MDQERNAWIGHVAPFAVWVGVILLLDALARIGHTPVWIYPWSYALKSLICAALVLWLKPWRYYPALQRAHLLPALGVGVAVALLWILPETPWLQRHAPGMQLFYHRWLILMPGTLPDYFDPTVFPALPMGHRSMAYAPESAGWGLTVMKLVGSAAVIAVIEEFFFRGFFYRWLRRGSFLSIPLQRFDAQAFWTMVLVFGLEHDRWFAGLVAGAAYGLLVLRTGDIWAAALAHALTNLTIGVHVVVSRQYGFW